MENVDLLISEEAQQDMDLKSAFAPAVPRQAFFRILLGDPNKAQEEWQTGNEPIARSYSKKPLLDFEPHTRGLCRTNSQVCSMHSCNMAEGSDTQT